VVNRLNVVNQEFGGKYYILAGKLCFFTAAGHIAASARISGGTHAGK